MILWAAPALCLLVWLNRAGFHHSLPLRAVTCCRVAVHPWLVPTFTLLTLPRCPGTALPFLPLPAEKPVLCPRIEPCSWSPALPFPWPCAGEDPQGHQFSGDQASAHPPVQQGLDRMVEGLCHLHRSREFSVPIVPLALGAAPGGGVEDGPFGLFFLPLAFV